MSSLILRIISAFAGLGIFFGIYYLFGKTGWLVIGSLSIVGVTREYIKMLLPGVSTSKPIQGLFFVLTLGFYLLFVFSSNLFFSLFPLGLVLFFSCLMFQGNKESVSLQEIQRQMLVSSLGFLYCALFPGCVMKLLMLENGAHWFMGYIFSIFAVDTFAYFGGLAFGKGKLMPRVSPKKTKMGAIFGLIGGSSYGLMASYFLVPDIPALWWIGATLISAFFAEIGDLFVSLMKRLAHVKDTGSIMPGHGGWMDRMDGIFFAGPVFYACALVMLHWSRV